jgi:hypothetical protein
VLPLPAALHEPYTELFCELLDEPPEAMKKPTRDRAAATTTPTPAHPFQPSQSLSRCQKDDDAEFTDANIPTPGSGMPPL